MGLKWTRRRFWRQKAISYVWLRGDRDVADRELVAIRARQLLGDLEELRIPWPHDTSAGRIVRQAAQDLLLAQQLAESGGAEEWDQLQSACELTGWQIAKAQAIYENRLAVLDEAEAVIEEAFAGD